MSNHNIQLVEKSAWETPHVTTLAIRATAAGEERSWNEGDTTLSDESRRRYAPSPARE